MKKVNNGISVSIPVGSHRGAYVPHTPPEVVAPEKKLTLFAFRLAILEKAASLIGVLAFIWATVVLLGGFANTLLPEDFWVVTFILVVEGVRLFSRSHELQFQREAVIDARRNRKSLRQLIGTSIFQSLTPRRRQPPLTAVTPSTRCSLLSPRRKWSPLDVPLLPFGGWFSVSRNVSTVFHWLQLLSALTGVALSLWRIAERDFTPGGDKQPEEFRNLEASLLIFYCLTLAEALLFLLEWAYWEVKVTFLNLFETATASCHLEDVDLVTIKRFYYNAYSKCIDGSIFDGLKTDLVDYGEKLLVSDLFEEQLMGVRILQSFTTNPTFSYDTLRKIETTWETVERLLEMLNWKSVDESDLRRYAAEVVAKLAEKEQNVIRLAEYPGAVQSVAGLLHAVRHYSEKPDKIAVRTVAVEESSYHYSLLGLSILRGLAGDYENCGKIGGTRGLLAKIIDLTFADEVILGGEGKCAEVVRMALLVVKILTSAKGAAGTALREQISGMVFTMSNMRQILLYGKSRPHMRWLAIEILTNLAMEEEGRERIGATGGILDVLLEIFLQESTNDDGSTTRTLREGAGRALAMLALESEDNCDAILRMDVLERLALGLKEEEGKKKVVTGRLLRNLCTYSGDVSRALLMGVASALPTVIQAILKEKGRFLEISIGLAAQILKLMTLEEATKAFSDTCVDDSKIVEKLCQLLEHYCKPTMSEMIGVPGMRRFTIELMMQMMKRGTHHIMAFKHQDVESKLKMVLNTTSPLECFNVFTGNVGLCPHRQTIHSLVDQAIGMLSSL